MTGARRDGWRSTNPATTGCPQAAVLPPSRAARDPGRMARPFEWATRRSRVGTAEARDGSGVPTRLRRVAGRRQGAAGVQSCARSGAYGEAIRVGDAS